ncbi:MAG: hypothetical protein V1809_13955 [Planctomycetota bacterium]
MMTVAEQMILSFAGVSIRLRLAGPRAWRREAAGRYAPFRIPAAPWVDVDAAIEVTGEPLPGGATGGESPAVVRDNGRLLLRRNDFSIVLSAPPRRRGRGWCEPRPHALDAMLRVLWATLLPEKDGFLVHGLGLEHDGRGILLAGKSGAGKTTFSRKCPADSVLSDELPALRRTAPGDWRISATPFWGEFVAGRGDLREIPLAATGLIARGPVLATERLHPAETAAGLLEGLVTFEGPAAARRFLPLAADLANCVPAFRTTLALDTPFSNLVSALMPHTTASPAPATRRGEITRFRNQLRQDGALALLPHGTSMLPSLRSGEPLFATPARSGRLRAGDIIAYWTPGRTAREDRLICHRLVARFPWNGDMIFIAKGDGISPLSIFRDGRDAEVLGKIILPKMDGIPDRWNPLLRSLAAMPWQWARGH